MRRFIPFQNKKKGVEEVQPVQIKKRKYIHANTALSSQGGYYFASNYAKIYNFPPPPTTPIVFGVISLGGSLYGSYNPTTRVLSSGDVQNYWQLCNIMPANQPTVMIVPVQGASIDVNGDGTDENTMDVSTLGACCPGSNVTIVVYVAPNTNTGFAAAFAAAVNGVTVNGKMVRSNIISCSWGAPEKYFYGKDYAAFNSIFQKANTLGIPICVASGDDGATDGERDKNVDFPSSSPYVIACGGTTLNCPNLVYDSSTSETSWSYTPQNGGAGGGYSAIYSMPSWQAALKSTNPVLNASTMRAVPDIAMNADPNTGVQFILKCTAVVFGGTSIVAPAMAALVGCLNIPSFTAANLYASLPSSFHDVTAGNIGLGFVAGKGYDCASGLGSPNGALLKAASAKLTR